MIQRSISFDFKAQYFSIGAEAADCSEIWFVLHGQGQLAKYFLRKFEAIADESRLIVAPEGLSRYYLNGYQGRVGASWMTKEERLVDIDNYLEYLSAVYRAVIEESERKDKKPNITLLGFSQGAATVSRWAQLKNIQFQTLILWAGIFPPDLNIEERASAFLDKSIFSVFGNKDEFLNDDKLLEQKEISNLLKVDPTEIVFDGGHEIDQTTLLKLATAVQNSSIGLS